jgi:hypothetical protein
MTEGCGGQYVRTIRKRGAEYGSEVAIAHGEFLRQVIIKRNVCLSVEADGLIVDGSFHAIVDLLGAVVDADETVHKALTESVAWIYVVGFLMGGEPGVIKVGSDAAAGLMEGEDLRAIVVEVGIETVEGASGVGQAREAIYATMVIGVAAIVSAWPMISRPGAYGSAPK